jgi:hypothetical protein
LVIEPWLERVIDFSIQLEMEPGGINLVGYSGLLNDWKGQYEGNWAGPGFKGRIDVNFPTWFPRVRDISRRVLNFYGKICERLEKELRPAAYFGPIGIDAFIYRANTGECRLKPIVEINPRYTMGRLVLELMHHVAPGSTGVFRLISPQEVKNDGFDGFPSWARALSQRMPLEREGRPRPKIRGGALCLTDPECAKAVLAVFEVTRGRFAPASVRGGPKRGQRAWGTGS